MVTSSILILSFLVMPLPGLQSSSQRISSYGTVGYAAELSKMAFYRMRYLITTESDWAVITISSNQTHAAAVYDICEGKDAPGLRIWWDDKNVGINKNQYDTTKVIVNVTLLITGLDSSSPVVYTITKGSLKYTTLVIQNFNSNSASIVANVTNSLTGSAENPLTFEVEVGVLMNMGPENIKFNRLEKKVLAFYYPWYGTPWGSHGCWAHWNEAGHNPDIYIGGRRDIAAVHYPLIDVYDSWDPSLIQYHLRLVKDSGIDVLIFSWFGVSSGTDQGLRCFLDYIDYGGNEVGNLSITVYYETLKNRDLEKEQALNQTIYDLTYVMNQYSNRKAFFRADGKPVIFIYSAEFFSVQDWKHILAEVRKVRDAYFIGNTLNVSYLAAFDGLHVYNPLRIEGDKLGLIYQQMSLYAHAWTLLAQDSTEKIFIATVSPGYDDTKVRAPSLIVSREGGLTYKKSWEIALHSAPDWIIITSFNEWHEGTEIEPSVEYGSYYLNLTRDFSDQFRLSG